MQIDLSDSTSKVCYSSDDQITYSIDLTGTSLMFQGAVKTKLITTYCGEKKTLPVFVDDEELISTKYSFIYDNGPTMWLDEDDDGWFPSSVNFFLKQTSPESDDGILRTTTTIPLTKPEDKQDFFHGQKPVDGLGAPCQTMILPVLSEDALDPVEILLNPEVNEVQVFYSYFFPYDWVKYQLD